MPTFKPGDRVRYAEKILEDNPDGPHIGATGTITAVLNPSEIWVHFDNYPYEPGITYLDDELQHLPLANPGFSHRAKLAEQRGHLVTE